MYTDWNYDNEDDNGDLGKWLIKGIIQKVQVHIIIEFLMCFLPNFYRRRQYSDRCGCSYRFFFYLFLFQFYSLWQQEREKKPQSWNVVKCCGTSSVQILRRQGHVVSSSLHKPSTADMGVVRGVTEHSNWTSQTLKEASFGLSLMLPDLASGTERKCCRTRRGHRPSWS